jgi:hypothetical protein
MTHSYCSTRRIRLLYLIGVLPHSAIPWQGLPPPSDLGSARGRLLRSRLALSSETPGRLVAVLEKHGYEKRLETITQESLPRFAEVYVNSQSTIAKLISFQATRNSTEPKALVELLGSSSAGRESSQLTIDFGQITTIWNEETSKSDISIRSLSIGRAALPDKYVERELDKIYYSRVGRARSSSSTMGLSKNQVSSIVQQCFDNEHERAVADTVLRRVLKAGSGFARLLDSKLVSESLYGSRHSNNSIAQRIQEQASAAYCLSRDATLGGRFKRWPSLFVAQYSLDKDHTVAVTVINGGWLVLDQSVRAGTEARKFVERSGQDSAGDGRNSCLVKMATLADERIVRRMECLAMGELFSERGEERILETDVREALNGMNLPLTPTGAKAALTRIGLWTGEPATERIQFWPRPVLDAAAWYVQFSKQRRSENLINKENRTDLTSLPCISVDAKSVSFRDDAVGVRPRAGTGRKVTEEASKWEILLHIADASDIYTPNAVPGDDEDYLSLLRIASESRGASRYDLPSGPLHLLPPIVLEELCLRGDSFGNRCVTLWAYIDERDGRLLDAGIERTLVAPAIKYSFLEASTIMEGKGDAMEGGDSMRKARAVLLVVERNLKSWYERRLQSSEVAQKREQRMSSKESPAPLLKTLRDNGSDGFFRSRGHRLVDSSLDLYAYALSGLLRRANAPMPRARGADASRGGRLATSPLRRFIDGQSQRQALAVCCDFGRPMTPLECREAGSKSNEARNALANIRAGRS